MSNLKKQIEQNGAQTNDSERIRVINVEKDEIEKQLREQLQNEHVQKIYQIIEQYNQMYNNKLNEEM